MKDTFGRDEARQRKKLGEILRMKVFGSSGNSLAAADITRVQNLPVWPLPGDGHGYSNGLVMIAVTFVIDPRPNSTHMS